MRGKGAEGTTGGVSGRTQGGWIRVDPGCVDTVLEIHRDRGSRAQRERRLTREALGMRG